MSADLKVNPLQKLPSQQHLEVFGQISVCYGLAKLTCKINQRCKKESVDNSSRRLPMNSLEPERQVESRNCFFLQRRCLNMFDHRAIILGIIMNISLMWCSEKTILGNSGLRTQSSVGIFFFLIISVSITQTNTVDTAFQHPLRSICGCCLRNESIDSC